MKASHVEQLSRNPAEARYARSRRVCASSGWRLPSGRAQDAASREWHNLPLEEPLQRTSWRGRRITSPRVGSQAADGRFVTSSQQRRGDQRASSFAEPADVFKPNAAPCVVVNPVTLAVMWPKRGCRSGPPLPAYGVSIPTLLHASTRGKFSSAG